MKASISPLQTPKCWTGRFLMNLWAIFCLLVLSSYTANLAAVMVGEKTFEQVSGIHDDKVRLQTRTQTCNCMHVIRPHTHRHTDPQLHVCTHQLIWDKDRLMSKERNYLWRIIAFRIPKPCREFRARMNFIWALSWHHPPSPFITSITIPTHVSCVTSSVAPSLPGLPFRDGEGEQRRGLHEEELPGDAWLHETLQPAHHPRRRAYVKVRDTYIDLLRTQTQYRAQQSSHGYVCYLCLSLLCALFFCMCTVHHNSVYWWQEQTFQVFVHQLQKYVSTWHHHSKFWMLWYQVQWSCLYHLLPLTSM